MVNIACVLAAALCGGVLYRCRGGFIGTGSTTVARVLWWAFPTAALITVLHHAQSGAWSLWLFVLTLLAVWLALLIPHGYAQNKSVEDYWDMAGIGALRMVVLAAIVCFWHWLWAVWLIVAGCLQGAAYAIGWQLLDGKELIKWHPKNPHADDGSGFDRFAISGGEWGEVLNGAFFWAAIVAAALPW